MEDIDALKHGTQGPPRYRLANASVFVSPNGFHYIDYLDPVEEISPEIEGDSLSEDEIAYIESQLQSNAERFDHQVAAVQRFADVNGSRVLDIGCGGGLFLSKMRDQGATVMGLELSDSRALYATRQYGMEIVKHPVESDYWAKHAESFDVVTLWDVIEHVNYPRATLTAAAGLVKTGGLLLIDTPCRDAFYHRAGVLTYRLSGGRYPTLLNAMYSAHRFGHKQIFATHEMRQLFEVAQVQVLDLKKFHELSFPYRFYLKNLLKSNIAASVALPFVKIALAIAPVRNKMLVVGRKA